MLHFIIYINASKSSYNPFNRKQNQNIKNKKKEIN